MKSILTGMIEKNSWQGLEDFFNALAKSLHLEAEETAIATVKRKSRRRRRPSIPRVSLEEIRPIRGCESNNIKLFFLLID